MLTAIRKFNINSKLIPLNLQNFTMSINSEEIKVIHDKKNKEFYIPYNEGKAILQYEIIDSSGSVDLLHTEVPPALRGKGIGKILAKDVLDHFSSQKIPFKLTCWYLRKYYEENTRSDYTENLIQS